MSLTKQDRAGYIALRDRLRDVQNACVDRVLGFLEGERMMRCREAVDMVLAEMEARKQQIDRITDLLTAEKEKNNSYLTEKWSDEFIANLIRDHELLEAILETTSLPLWSRQAKGFCDLLKNISVLHDALEEGKRK